MKYTLPVLFVFLSASVVMGQWKSSPFINNKVAATSDHELAPVSVSDGKGGSIVFYRVGNDIKAQKITSSGAIAWGDTLNSVTICTGSTFRMLPLADGAGGGYLVWEDYRNNVNNRELYVQHISASGVPVWTQNGVRVTYNGNVQDNYSPFLCSDGNGGVILGWTGDDLVGNVQLYTQRLTSNGAPLWQSNGIRVCTAPGFRYGYYAVEDGHGGAIFSFVDTRNDPNGLNYQYLDSSFINLDIYGQRIDAAGNRLWSGTGSPVSLAPGNQRSRDYFSGVRTNTNVVSDGHGGALFVFDDGRNDSTGTYRYADNNDIYIQKLDSAGNAVWPTNGVPVCNADSNQNLENIIQDGSGGAVVCWNFQNDRYMYAQRISGSGTRLWPVDGIQLSPSGGRSHIAGGLYDGAGNYVFVFMFQGTQYTELKAQKINGAGILQWGANGTLISNTYHNSDIQIQLVSSNSSSFIASWYDYKKPGSVSFDIFASRILDNGTLAHTYFTNGTGNWHTPATWVGGIVPPGSALVVIRHAITVTGNATCFSLLVEPPNGTVTVKAGAQLTVTH
ncbi:MAG: hypothetical protein V4722_01695 [Bacteroidota bacterium]